MSIHDKEGSSFREWFIKETDILVETSKKIIFKEQHVPALFIYGPRNQVLTVPVPMDTLEDKDRLAWLHRSFANDPSHKLIKGVIFITETWVLLTPNKEDFGKEGIANHPDRTEALMFNGILNDEQLLRMYSIDRVNKKLGEPRLIDTQRDGLHAGRMVLPPQGKPS